MRIEIDFGGRESRGTWYRGALALLPILAIGFCLWFWSRPILSTLTPFALAFVFAYLLNPAVDWLSGERRKVLRMHRAFAILILLLVLVGVVGGAIGYIAPAIVREGASFAGWVRGEIFPSVREKLRPQADRWLWEGSALDNGDFSKWEGAVPANWKLAGGARLEPIRQGAPGVLVVPEGGEWALFQRFAGLVGDETYTLVVASGTPTAESPGASWVLHFFDGVSPTPLATTGSEFEAGALVSKPVYVPPSTDFARLEIRSAPPDHAGIRIEAIQLLKPRPFPYFEAAYWVDWYERNSHRFSLAALGRLATYGLRGAGMVAEGAGGVWSWISSRMGGAVSFLIYTAMLVVIMFYMLLDFAAFKRSCLELVPEKFQDRFVSIMTDIDRSVGGFIRGQATVCAFVGGLVTLAMLILQVPFAILIGLCAGIFGFIPYLGPIVGLTPGVILTLLEYLDPDVSAQWVTLKLGLVVGSFMLIQMAEGFIISPKVMSESVDVPPLVVMGALMLGGSIAGVTGMVLAIPGYCILRVLVGEYRKELRRAFRASSDPSP